MFQIIEAFSGRIGVLSIHEDALEHFGHRADDGILFDAFVGNEAHRLGLAQKEEYVFPGGVVANDTRIRYFAHIVEVAHIVLLGRHILVVDAVKAVDEHEHSREQNNYEVAQSFKSQVDFRVRKSATNEARKEQEQEADGEQGEGDQRADREQENGAHGEVETGPVFVVVASESGELFGLAHLGLGQIRQSLEHARNVANHEDCVQNVKNQENRQPGHDDLFN